MGLVWERSLPRSEAVIEDIYYIYLKGRQAVVGMEMVGFVKYSLGDGD